MLRYLVLRLVLEKEVSTMATVYATLIIKGVKTFSQVPDKLKPQVKEILIALECEDMAQ